MGMRGMQVAGQSQTARMASYMRPVSGVERKSVVGLGRGEFTVPSEGTAVFEADSRTGFRPDLRLSPKSTEFGKGVFDTFIVTEKSPRLEPLPVLIPKKESVEEEYLGKDTLEGEILRGGV
jgi:hypothetical protein